MQNSTTTRRAELLMTFKRLSLFGAGVGMWLGASVARGQNTLPAPTAQPIGISLQSAGFLNDSDSVRRKPRPRAIEYSDWYGRRLTIHKIGSYVMLPLFGAEYYLGERLIQGKASGNERSFHAGVASAIGIVFGVNTVTGAWNLWDSRNDPSDRTKRIVHSVLMLSADAGFALAAASANGEDDGREGGDGGDNNTHKTIALTSIGISTVGTALMWFFK
jgi:hypothetical protein